MLSDKYSVFAMVRKKIHSDNKISFLVCTAFFIALGCSAALAQQPKDLFSRPAALEDRAFDAPMTLSWATSKGNMNTSVWIAATGVIHQDTPDQFRSFLEREGGAGGQLIAAFARR